MYIYYISSSIIPARSANSVHTSNMFKALVCIGHKTTLFISSTQSKKKINSLFDFKLNGSRIKRSFNAFNKGIEFCNFIVAFFNYYLDIFFLRKPNLIISRNIFAAYYFNFFSTTKVVYEFHAPETGFRKNIQKKLLLSKKLQKIVISSALKRIIVDYYNLKNTKNIYVVHDSAPDIDNYKIDKRKYFGKSVLKYKYKIGYFGHLYKGRGIQLIKEIALLNSECAFLVYGGMQKDIDRELKTSNPKNFYIMGYVPHVEAIANMKNMDILLMPYQKKVSVGIKNSDTSKWMSPIKLFEYMSSKVPIISSDLPVLREVIQNKVNAVLVSDPTNAKLWTKAINFLLTNNEVAKKISNNAYSDFYNKYTWSKRAELIIRISSE